MSEQDLIELTFDATDAILQIVALYFSIVSAYIAALHYFLHRTAFLLRFIAFAFVSAALLFLGLMSIGVERATAGVVDALNTFPGRIAAPPPTDIYFGFEHLFANIIGYGVMAGWLMAFLIYTGLFFLTFLHRWDPKTD